MFEIKAGTARLAVGDCVLELLIVAGTENEKAFKIDELRSETGFIALDEGFSASSFDHAPTERRPVERSDAHSRTV